jgi:hypothetical protein
VSPGKHVGPHTKMVAHQRDGYGCVVSFSNDQGMTHTVYREGKLKDALLACIREIDRRADDGPWYVECISTPQTIYDDMQGTFRRERHSRERLALARVGRKDLLRVPLLHIVDSTKRPGHGLRNLYRNRRR